MSALPQPFKIPLGLSGDTFLDIYLQVGQNYPLPNVMFDAQDACHLRGLPYPFLRAMYCPPIADSEGDSDRSETDSAILKIFAELELEALKRENHPRNLQEILDDFEQMQYIHLPEKIPVIDNTTIKLNVQCTEDPDAVAVVSRYVETTQIRVPLSRIRFVFSGFGPRDIEDLPAYRWVESNMGSLDSETCNGRIQELESIFLCCCGRIENADDRETSVMNELRVKNHQRGNDDNEQLQSEFVSLIVAAADANLCGSSTLLEMLLKIRKKVGLSLNQKCPYSGKTPMEAAMTAMPDGNESERANMLREVGAQDAK